MANESLKALFESQQEELRSKLQNLTLPEDANRVEVIVTQYLNSLFDRDGEFRLQLSQSEDYIMQAAMSLLSSQQAIVSEISKTAVRINVKKDTQKMKATTGKLSDGIDRKAVPYGIGGSTIGGAIGGVVLGTWGAVFGSIAGTALALYYVSTYDNQASKKNVTIPAQKESRPAIKLDVDKFVQIVTGICDSIDNLIATYRAQIKRVVSKYEQQSKVTLDSNFRPLVEGIQSLIGYERYHTAAEEKYIVKLQERIEDLVELLDSYNLEVIDYSEENSGMFEKTESSKATEVKKVLPAIAKDGVIVLRGKVFIPED